MTAAPRSVRVARPLARPSAPKLWWRALVGLAMVGTGIVLALGQGDDLAVPPWLIPAIIYAAALVLVWSPLDAVVAGDAKRPDVMSLVSRDAWLRIVVGLLAAAFAVWLFAVSKFTTSPLVRTWVVVGVAMLATALLLAPWWLRLIRQVTVERERRVREFERAEIAAHLHDSVLQTLTLIRAHASEPETVARLARAQERDLRSYLYQERRSPSESVVAALAAAISEVEDAHGVAIEVVTVGDVPTTPALAAAVSAAREAATNAARHGVGPISVYGEVTPGGYEVFVRDGGPGFDPDAVPEDRLGIRNSIVGRVRRAGGDAVIRSAAGEPTEVTITVPREETT
ncbi:sensor histidine kinase [Demequina sp.]|uniref:sensor histidine kinase n=1 Tax=Demequina sp. TaxID=2050685 RepID=UPI003D0C83C4